MSGAHGLYKIMEDGFIIQVKHDQVQSRNQSRPLTKSKRGKGEKKESVKISSAKKKGGL